MHRPIRSYAVRSTRLSAAQRRACERYWRRYAIDFPFRPMRLVDCFAHPGRPLIVEIGSGMGDATIELAHRFPQWNIVAVEMHMPGIGKLLLAIARQGIDTIRVLRHDAAEVLAAMAGVRSITGIAIFFPDPWPKKRHHKRRLVDANFLRMAATTIVPNGFLYLATDWLHYAEQMASAAQEARSLFRPAKPGEWGKAQEEGVQEGTTALEAHGAASVANVANVANTTDSDAVSNRQPFGNPAPLLSSPFIRAMAWRPTTAFERKAKAAGRPVFELFLVRDG